MSSNALEVDFCINRLFQKKKAISLVLFIKFLIVYLI